jgi:hypothetical protein
MAEHCAVLADIFRLVGDAETVLEVLGKCFQSASWPVDKEKRLNLQALLLKGAAEAAAKLQLVEKVAEFDGLGAKVVGSKETWQGVRSTSIKDEQDRLILNASIGGVRSLVEWRQALRPILMDSSEAQFATMTNSARTASLWSQKCLEAVRALQFPFPCSKELEVWQLNASPRLHRPGLSAPPAGNVLADPLSCLHSPLLSGHHCRTLLAASAGNIAAQYRKHQFDPRTFSQQAGTASSLCPLPRSHRGGGWAKAAAVSAWACSHPIGTLCTQCAGWSTLSCATIHAPCCT